jgi:hypothetical protein
MEWKKNQFPFLFEDILEFLNNIQEKVLGYTGILMEKVGGLINMKANEMQACLKEAEELGCLKKNAKRKPDLILCGGSFCWEINPRKRNLREGSFSKRDLEREKKAWGEVSISSICKRRLFSIWVTMAFHVLKKTFQNPKNVQNQMFSQVHHGEPCCLFLT